jgi:hypothetical protein
VTLFIQILPVLQSCSSLGYEDAAAKTECGKSYNPLKSIRNKNFKSEEPHDRIRTSDHVHTGLFIEYSLSCPFPSIKRLSTPTRFGDFLLDPQQWTMFSLQISWISYSNGTTMELYLGLDRIVIIFESMVGSLFTTCSSIWRNMDMAKDRKVGDSRS